MNEHFRNLPESDNLNTFALSRLFSRKTTSYKFLFFLSLLDILDRNNFDASSPIEFRELVVGMLVNAWFPHHYFNLSFGTQDKITYKLDSLRLQISESALNLTDFNKNCLREAINKQNLEDIVAYIVRYVPFRLITPFLKTELKGIDIDHGVDRETPRLARLYFESHKPLYCFDSTDRSECNAIIIHPEWALYLQQNHFLIREWVCWEWVKYMQARNPKVLDIETQLFPQ
ncbi:MAG: hypothetical protein LRZ84_00970 [Desertifilum sp.]|nr:hypothetical protein [Desertifilum sp.]